MAHCMMKRSKENNDSALKKFSRCSKNLKKGFYRLHFCHNDNMLVNSKYYVTHPIWECEEKGTEKNLSRLKRSTGVD